MWFFVLWSFFFKYFRKIRFISYSSNCYVLYFRYCIKSISRFLYVFSQHMRSPSINDVLPSVKWMIPIYVTNTSIPVIFNYLFLNFQYYIPLMDEISLILLWRINKCCLRYIIRFCYIQFWDWCVSRIYLINIQLFRKHNAVAHVQFLIILFSGYMILLRKWKFNTRVTYVPYRKSYLYNNNALIHSKIEWNALRLLFELFENDYLQL